MINGIKHTILVQIGFIFFTGFLNAQTTVASFSVNQASGCSPLTVLFTNTSTAATSYYWDFGNGNSSVLENPSNVYSSAGVYTVKLVANGPGGTDSVISSNLITVSANSNPDFNVSHTTVCMDGNAISFVNASSNATSYLWDFGDGNTSSLQHPTHTYVSQGAYTIKLISYDTYGCPSLKIMSDYIRIKTNPVSEFTVNTNTSCDPGQLFGFSSSTPDATAWSWDFGDGTSSTLQNPAHTYPSSGNYTVSLTTTNSSGCSNTLTQYDYIAIETPLLPSFTSTFSSSCIPVEVSFTNQTTNAEGFLWNFGDGTTSNDADPIHLYQNTGSYSVSLTTTSYSGCTYTTTLNNHIHITNNPVANFSVGNTNGCSPIITFTNTSSNNTSQLWEFGDGYTSTQQNPSHQYSEAGTFAVTLHSYNNSGCESVKQIPNAVNLVIPVADFNANYTPACAPLTASFTNTSENSVQWLWDFGDGNTSTLKNPSHTYSLPGNFDVSLIAIDANGCSDTVVFNSLIYVINTAGNFVTPPTVNGCIPFNTTFSSTSQGATSWLWDFGDGTTSTLQNPSHTYTVAGVYTVSLLVQSNSGCTQYYPSFRIFDIKGTQAYFTLSDQQICASTAITFTGQGNSSSFWDFGDGATSTLNNPFHTYTLPGFYSVKYTATSPGTCSSTIIKVNCIHVISCSTEGGAGNSTGGDGNVWNEGTGTTPPLPVVKACIPFDVQFSNTISSTVSWHWDFGDGSTSTLQHPLHTYTNPGNYTITLNAQTTSGTTQTVTYTNYVEAQGSTADFTLVENGNCQNSAVTLNPSSSGASSYHWDFGDGFTSTAQSPSHTYSTSTNNYIVTLTTTTTQGCSANLSKSLLLTGTSPAIWANEYNVCANETIAFSCLPGDYTSYSWNFGDGSVSSVSNPSHTYQLAGTFPVTLTVTDSRGCTHTALMQSQINVKKTQAAFKYSLNNNCTSQTVNFTNTSTGTGMPLSAHCKWNFGDGSPEIWSESPTHIFPAQGTYQVTLTVQNGNCTNSITKTVHVHPMLADFSFIQNTSCLPVTATYTDLSSAAASWLWDFGDGTTSTLQNPVHTFVNAPGSEVILTVTGENGCQATITKTNITFFNADFGLSVAEGCAPMSVDFYDASANANQWTWDFGDGSTSTLQNPSHMYTTNGSFIVKLISKSTSGCLDTMIFDAITAKKPVASFISANPTNCSPALVTFTDSSVSADSWLWDFGDGSSSVSQSPGHVYNIPGLYTIKLVVANTYGCSDTLVRVDYIEVPGSIANFSLSASQACAGSFVQFTDLSVNASGWNWNFGDGNTSSQKNPSNSYLQPGQYTVSLIVHDSHGCSSNFTLPNPVTINPLPIAGFAISDSISCTPFPLTFHNLSQNAVTYSWNFGDGTSSAEQNPSHTYVNSGNYSATLTATNAYGCSATKTISPIVAKPSPHADFTMNAPAGCSPFVATLTNTTVHANNITYQWNLGNGNTSSVQNTSATYTSPGFYTVSLIAINNNGCSDTIVKTNSIQVYDFNPPLKSELRVVTVVSDTSVQVTWNQNDATDFASYKIYRKDNANGLYSAVATITNRSSNSFLDIGLNTLSNSYCYKVQALDICGYTQDLDSLQEHCTVNVSAKGINDDIQLNWTPYIGAIPETYLVYRLEAAMANPVLIGTVPGNNLTYTDTTLPCPHFYSYRIKANKLNGAPISSNSDTCVAKPPQNVLIQQKVDVVRSTVIENSKVLTEWKAPAIAPEKVAGYAIYKSEDNTNFSLLTNVDAVVHDYVDDVVDVNAKNYYYKVKALNFCDIVAADGNKSSSILLQAELIDGTVNLKWTGYEGWNMGVDYYIIEKLDENGEWKTIERIEGNTLEYEDNN